MQDTPSPKPRNLSRKAAIATGLAAVLGGGVAAVTGAVPAAAADLAQQPDTQIAVFMVPVTLLMAVMMFEVGRFAWRNRIPNMTPQRRRPTNWSSGKSAR